MPSEYYVCSTLSAPTSYANYEAGASDLPIKIAQVTIAGGANVVGQNFITPLGVITKVSEDEMTVLQKNPVFKMHERNGFIRVEEKKNDVEIVVADMEGRDKSAPLVEADFDAEKSGAKPSNRKK